ncbi:ribosome maturation factor RimM [Pseudoroseomonas cervicalis]|uniref:ribosome maturation factor RimM n=1 Tax=Teichococcus cervicalis TaxID=204525 RepID=UPI0027887B24|nr:ribosome maturation factor RimM [Pseudoroseomonas cervicalis]MDQ1078292.1 16S rRNA processing protein RimM [Pseudoroseomonas cervicalis]
MPAQRILVGEIGRPHGVRGIVRINAFTTDPAAIAGYGPLSDESGGRRFVLQWLGNGLARIDGIADRDAAARLTGTRLYVERDRLPATEEEEFYLADLIGLAVRDGSGATLGSVRSVEDYGAGSYLTVIDGEGRELLLPFTRAVVPVVSIAEGYLVAEPPEAVVVPPQPGEAEMEATLPETPLAEPVRALPRRQDAPKRTGPRGVRGGAA